MSLSIVRLGTPRAPQEGPRLGTVRFPPRGVPKAEIATRDFYDVWFPLLAPSAELIKSFRDDDGDDDEKNWARFARAFRREMKEAEAARVLDLFALLSHSTHLSLGCYCENEARCHRSVLRELLIERGAEIS